MVRYSDHHLNTGQICPLFEWSEPNIYIAMQPLPSLSLPFEHQTYVSAIHMASELQTKCTSSLLFKWSCYSKEQYSDPHCKCK